MRRFRPELFRGLIVLGIIFAVIISTELLLPCPIEHTRYMSIDIRRIIENPVPFEGQEISSAATVIAVISNESFSIAEVTEGVILIFPSSVGHPGEGDRVIVPLVRRIQKSNFATV